NGVVQNKREIAAYGLEARDFTCRRLAQRQLVETVDVDFAYQDCCVFEFTRGSDVWMQLAEPADCDAISGDARRAIGMEPCGHQPRLRREAIEIGGAHLKARKNLLDDAFDVMKINCAGGVKNGLIRKRAGSHKRKRGSLIDFLCEAFLDGSA